MHKKFSRYVDRPDECIAAERNSRSTLQWEVRSGRRLYLLTRRPAPPGNSFVTDAVEILVLSAGLNVHRVKYCVTCDRTLYSAFNACSDGIALRAIYWWLAATHGDLKIKPIMLLFAISSVSADHCYDAYLLTAMKLLVCYDDSVLLSSFISWLH